MRAEVDRESGDFKIFSQKNVVADEEPIEDEMESISLSAASKHGEYDIGDIYEYDTTPKAFGRIAAQTAKQVLLQRLREAERERMVNDFSGKLYEIITGVVQRVENGNVYVELGRYEGLLPISEQVENERYRQGDRLKVYILKVDKDARGRNTPRHRFKEKQRDHQALVRA